MRTQTMPGTATDTSTSRERAVAKDWSVKRPIIVGVDDTKEAYPALKYAAELSLLTGSRVHMVSALKPYRGIGSGSPGEERTTELRLELREVFLEDLLPTVVAPPVWTRIAQIGDPANVLAREARDVRAGLIILGVGRRGTVERILNRPTAMRVIQKVDIPIVVVPRGATPPRSAVVGVDFSPASLFACRAAAAILGETGELHLVYVESIVPVPGEVWSVDLSMVDISDTGARLGKFQLDANVPSGIRVERAVIKGDIAPALERYAASVGADLIAVGSHGYNFAQRAMLGSVSAALIARPTLAVLVAASGGGQ